MRQKKPAPGVTISNTTVSGIGPTETESQARLSLAKAIEANAVAAKTLAEVLGPNTKYIGILIEAPKS